MSLAAQGEAPRKELSQWLKGEPETHCWADSAKQTEALLQDKGFGDEG
jgi:hypothetical protein